MVGDGERGEEERRRGAWCVTQDAAARGPPGLRVRRFFTIFFTASSLRVTARLCDCE